MIPGTSLGLDPAGALALFPRALRLPVAWPPVRVRHPERGWVSKCTNIRHRRMRGLRRSSAVRSETGETSCCWRTDLFRKYFSEMFMPYRVVKKCTQ